MQREHKELLIYFIIALALIILSLYTAPVQAREITIEWDANSEPDLDHYVVHWGPAAGEYDHNSIDSGDDIGWNTTYTAVIPDTGVYYFAVTAVDDDGLESAYSDEVVSKGEPVGDSPILTGEGKIVDI